MSTCAFRRASAADLAPLHAFLLGFADHEAPSRGDLSAWLEDPNLELAIGECGGETVACGSLDLVGSREAWIGGQRVHQGPRQPALLQGLTEFQTDRARQRELRVVRAAWQSSNAQMHKISSRMGYHRVASFGVFSSEALGTGAPVLSILTERDYSPIQNWLGRSSLCRAGAGLYQSAGRWMELTARQVRGLLAQGQVLGLRGASGNLDAFAILGSGDPGSPGQLVTLGYVDAEWQCLERLALALRGLALVKGPGRTRAYLVDDPGLRGAFQAAGFQDEWDGRELCVFERFL